VVAGVHADHCQARSRSAHHGEWLRKWYRGPLPQDWLSAITAAEGSTFLHEALGEEFLRAYLAIKIQEWNKYHALVPATDHDWYLDSV
jgi:glutamine synthetase